MSQQAAEQERIQAWFAEFGATRSEAARDELVRLHQNLVRYIAMKFAGRGEPLEDIIQVGMIGLIKAIERFDPKHGVKFTTFAVPTVFGEIRRYFRDHCTSMKFSRIVCELQQAVARYVEEYTREHGVAPTAKVVAEKLETTEERVLEAQEFWRVSRVGSLEAVVGTSGESVLDHMGADDGEIEQVEQRMLIERASSVLTDRERAIIQARFFDLKTQSQIAADWNVSQMQISRIERSALQKMRGALECVA